MSALVHSFCYCTVRIECLDSNGQISSGTGFLYRFKEPNEQYIPIVVTNKHVVQGMTTGRFIMTKTNPDGRTPNDTDHFRVVLPELQKFIRYHPDEDVDLCALRFAPILDLATDQNVQLYYTFLSSNAIPTPEKLNELTALEDILMIGYPIGIYDSVNNMPIFRRGSTATHPALKYNGKMEFMIDAACFPGSSGSPVLIYNPVNYTTKTGELIQRSRVLLMGVLYAGPTMATTGEIRQVDIPTSQRFESVSSIPTNLGYVIRFERILELRQLFN